MKRRQFIALVGAAVAGLSAAAADQRKRPRRIAVLMGVPVGDSEGQARVKAFQQGLELAGWVEGDNIEIEYRWGAAEPAAFRTHADELVDQRPEVILANTPPAVTALCERTKTIPIVFTGVSSPLEAGIVESLAHPGGNVTGFSTFDPAMGGTWV
jgi:putative ABC transport system substrate-binding protein